jgi:prepilin-type processing-associated H-X9-DG protein
MKSVGERSRGPFHRRAATLLELVVVLGIVGLLTGLLLPGVQKARDAAARASCASRLRQLTLGVHHFASTGRAMPAGCDYPLAASESDTLRHAGVSWHTALLPYVEHQPLGDEARHVYYQDPVGNNNPAHARLRERVVAAYLCPSDARALGTDGANRWGLTSYQGVAGTAARRNDGLFHRALRVRLHEVLDGTSSTVMIGERPAGPHGAFGGWYGSWGESTCGVAQLLPAGHHSLLLTRVADCPRPRPPLHPGGLHDACAAGHYWSLHASGAHFAFADGSVRFLAYSAASVLPALATRAGGEAVALPD